MITVPRIERIDENGIAYVGGKPYGRVITPEVRAAVSWPPVGFPRIAAVLDDYADFPRTSDPEPDPAPRAVVLLK